MKEVVFLIITAAWIALFIGVPAAIIANGIWPLRERYLRRKAHEAMYPRKEVTQENLREMAFRPERYEPDARDWLEQPD